MKPLCHGLAIFFAATVVSISSFSEDLQAVPDGNYLLTVEIDGKPQRLNLKVQANRAKCVKSSDPSLAGVEGQFQPFRGQQFADRTFVARFRNGLGSQVWI